MLPDELAKRYEAQAVLGRGGSGMVIRARTRSTGRPVAVKLLLPEVSAQEEAQDRFRSEATVARRISHPNVVSVIEFGLTPDGTLFLVSELVEGYSLREVLNKREKISADRTIGLARSLLAGLAAIHDAGVIHRDVTPTNLLVDRRGTLKIIDFGIARDLVDRIHRTQTGDILGTPWYLSPENIRGENLTTASDVYAAGVVLHELLVGEPPFVGPTLSAILSAHLAGIQVPLGPRAPQAPAGLVKLVERMIQRDPLHRPATGREALKVLRGL